MDADLNDILRRLDSVESQVINLKEKVFLIGIFVGVLISRSGRVVESAEFHNALNEIDEKNGTHH